MVTASGDAEKVRAIEAGADDFVTKPLNQAELLARVRSLVRVKRYHDTVTAQAAALAEWNHELEARVHAQVAELERLGRLRRFLSPQIAQARRRQRGRVLPEEPSPRDRRRLHRPAGVHLVRRERPSRRRPWRCCADYHHALGELVFAYEGTLEHFAGDGLLVFFNDPVPCPDAPDRAVRMAVEMRARVAVLAQGWRQQGHDLGLRGGHRAGLRHPGPRRVSRAATTTPPSAPSPTSPPGCARSAGAGQILVSQRVRHGIEGPSRRARSGPWSSRDSAGRSRSTRSSACRRRRWSRHERRRTSTGRPSTSSTRRPATRSSTGSRRGCPEVWRVHAPGRPAGVGGRRAVDDPGPGRREQRQRRDEPGARGALPVLPPAAAPAAAADDLRDVAADRPAHRRVLPLAASRASSRATRARGCRSCPSTTPARSRSPRSCWRARG